VIVAFYTILNILEVFNTEKAKLSCERR